MQRHLRLGQQTWTDVIEGDPFQELLIAATSVSITYALLRSQDLPSYMLLHPVLILGGFLLAFQRIRLAREVEKITSPAWDAVTPFYTNAQRSIDHILDWPYLASLYVLPFTAFSATLLLGTFALLSAVTLAHETLFLRALRRYHAHHRYGPVDRAHCEVRNFFVRRMLVVGADVAISTAGAVAVVLLDASRSSAVAVAGAAIGGLMIVDGIAPYVLNRNAYTVSGLRSVVYETAQSLTREDALDLEAIFEAAFPESERVRSMDQIIESASDAERLLWVARYDGRIVGFLEMSMVDDTACCWWLAVDERWRGRGLGSGLLRTATDSLPPTIRFVVLESRADDQDAPRRLAFYRRLGGRRAVGVGHYVHAIDGSGSIPYDVVVFDRTGVLEPGPSLYAAAANVANGLDAREALRHRLAEASWD